MVIIVVMRFRGLVIFLNFLLLNSLMAIAEVGEKFPVYKHITQEELKNGIQLDFDWNFYWHQTYSDLQLNPALPKLIGIPGNWVEHGFERKGYGTVKCRIIAPHSKGTALGLYMPTICNAYNLYVDGQLLSKVGKFDSTPNNYQPDYKPKAVSFYTPKDTFEIAIELANFAYREGGVDYPITIGTAEKVSTIFESKLSISGITGGALLVMFFYFAIFSLVRKGEKTSLYFSLLCLVSALRIISTDVILLRQVPIYLSWHNLVKIELSSILLIPTFGALYLRELIEDKNWNKLYQFIHSITLVTCIFIVISGSYQASFIVPPFRYFAAFQMFLLFGVLIKATFITKHPLGKWTSIGYLIVFVLGLNDILYSVYIIHTFYTLPIAIFAFILIQAVVLAKKYGIAYIEVQDLSNKLKELNNNQETIIEKRTQELANYNQIKDKIFTIIGHDLRSPIATLSNVLNLAEQADDKTMSELRTYFKGIKRSVDNLNLTIENLFVWSQNQINGVQSNPTLVDINKEVEQIISLFSLLALQKEITLMHHLQSSYKAYVDQSHLNLILRNLVNNSLKFTNPGGTIQITASKPTDNQIQICIIDNGIGMSKDRLKGLDNPKIETTTYGTFNEKGTGLGLMLCKEYAEKNGGKIMIESIEGTGTKICILLPLNQKEITQLTE